MNIALIGVGHLGKIHIKCIKEIKELNLIGFYDTDYKNAKLVEQLYNIKHYDDLNALLEEADIIDIVTPTSSHFEIACNAMKKSKHVFLEKPICSTIEEAKEMIRFANIANIKNQVGHVERFNPAFKAAIPFIKNPKIIETHRTAPFNPRGMDVSVVLDLMVHDIDLILHSVNSNIKNISASAVKTINNTADIVNANIEFTNGCIASLFVNRIAANTTRELNIYQENLSLHIDLFNKITKLNKLINIEEVANNNYGTNDIICLGSGAEKILITESIEVEITNAIEEELRSFYKSIKENTSSPISFTDACRTLEVATEIENIIN